MFDVTHVYVLNVYSCYFDDELYFYDLETLLLYVKNNGFDDFHIKKCEIIKSID